MNLGVIYAQLGRLSDAVALWRGAFSVPRGAAQSA